MQCIADNLTRNNIFVSWLETTTVVNAFTQNHFVTPKLYHLVATLSLSVGATSNEKLATLTFLYEPIKCIS